MEKVYLLEETNLIGNLIGVDWAKYEQEQFRAGIIAELELNNSKPGTIITTVELFYFCIIVRDNLNAAPDYYSKLTRNGINREYHQILNESIMLLMLLQIQ